MTRPHRRFAGFTLLELLIAISVFAVVSMLAYGGLRSVQRTAEGVQDAGEKLAQLQTTFLVIARDVEQSVDRSIRDSFGQAQPAFVGAKGGVGAFIEFTRDGLRNPAGFARSNLQRVGYAMQDDKLVRLTWSTLDRSYGVEPAERVMMSGVKTVAVRYLDQDRQWQDRWPKLQVGNTPPPALPIAVEVTMEVDGWGTLQRLFRVAGDAPPQINTPAAAGGPGGNVPRSQSAARASGQQTTPQTTSPVQTTVDTGNDGSGNDPTDAGNVTD